MPLRGIWAEAWKKHVKTKKALKNKNKGKRAMHSATKETTLDTFDWFKKVLNELGNISMRSDTKEKSGLTSMSIQRQYEQGTCSGSTRCGNSRLYDFITFSSKGSLVRGVGLGCRWPWWRLSASIALSFLARLLPFIYISIPAKSCIAISEEPTFEKRMMCNKKSNILLAHSSAIRSLPQSKVTPWCNTSL